MTQREIREEIFKLLFEYEMLRGDIKVRKEEIAFNLNTNETKKVFFNNYIDEIVKNEENIIERIIPLLKGWTFSRLGNVEKVLLKMAFYEILISEVGYEIVVNEIVELSKIYGDENTKKFINGILADLIKTIEL